MKRLLRPAIALALLASPFEEAAAVYLATQLLRWVPAWSIGVALVLTAGQVRLRFVKQRK